jgi:hypothetical protein
MQKLSAKALDPQATQRGIFGFAFHGHLLF